MFGVGYYYYDVYEYIIKYNINQLDNIHIIKKIGFYFYGSEQFEQALTIFHLANDDIFEEAGCPLLSPAHKHWICIYFLMLISILY